MIATQCNKNYFDEQIKQQYPQAYEKYIHILERTSIPYCAILKNNAYIKCDNTWVAIMFAETDEELAECKIYLEKYANRIGENISYNLTETEISHDTPNVAQYRSCCVTGHRPKDLYGYDRQAYIPLKNAIMDRVEKMIKMGVDTFYNGMAQGADQIFFWAVHALKEKYPKIRNICYQTKGQELEWDINGAFGQKDYKLMLKYADEVIIGNILDILDIIEKVDIVLYIGENRLTEILQDKEIWEINPNELEEN